MNSHLRQHGFNNPTGVCCIAPGRVLVAENGRYQLVHCHGSAYEQREPVAGNGKQADQARLFCPRFAVCASSQIVYFTDANCIRRFVPATKEVRTIAGVPAKLPNSSTPDVSGSSSSNLSEAARFNAPWGLALDEDSGVLYVADSCNHSVKRVEVASGEVVTFVPSGSGLRYPIGLAIDRACEWLYCSDEGGIKRIEISSGTVSTWAGYSNGLQDGPGLLAKFSGPRGICMDYNGNLWVADRGNSCIRMITPEGTVSTVVPGGVVTQPYALDVSHKGELVVTDAYQGVLHVFDFNLQRHDHIKVPLSSYSARMVELLETAEAADVAFEVCGERIKAHKLILITQCDYFKKMLAPEQFAEGCTNTVQVQDTTPAAFKALLRYLYTDELRFSDDTILDVMLLAQKMVIHRVLNHCLVHIRHNLSPRSVVHWLMWADEHSGFGELRSTAFNYLVSNFKDVRKDKQQLAHLLARRPDLVMDVMLEL
ncbi:hypothetical protein COO60DRAFT_1473285 [Scenedesmus sp. NREL 46B-D3]|nr:hypothetical protein COO60DRAFT_1473285 [Scenedesmus sp. NREL 46B-D3]